MWDNLMANHAGWTHQNPHQIWQDKLHSQNCDWQWKETIMKRMRQAGTHRHTASNQSVHLLWWYNFYDISVSTLAHSVNPNSQPTRCFHCAPLTCADLLAISSVTPNGPLLLWAHHTIHCAVCMNASLVQLLCCVTVVRHTILFCQPLTGPLSGLFSCFFFGLFDHNSTIPLMRDFLKRWFVHNQASGNVSLAYEALAVMREATSEYSNEGTKYDYSQWTSLETLLSIYFLQMS